MRKLIAFTGFMGSGKTTLSKLFSKKYKIPVLSLDSIIESRENAFIKDIFLKFGENYFRDLEHKTLLDVVTKNENSIIDLGGGAFIFERNRRVLKNNATTIFLNPKFDTICRRIEHQRESRPMLKKENWIDEAKKLYDYRFPFYNQADLVVDIEENDNAESVLINIVKLLEKHEGKNK